MKQQFREDTAGTIRLTIYADNRVVTPDSVNITIYKPDGAVLQAQTAATIDGTTSELQYSLTSTHTADKGLNYKAVWDYVYDSKTYYETQLFDVVKSVLSVPITDDDLFAELPALRRVTEQSTGTATAGAAGSLTDTTNRLKEADDYWKGGVIEILAGTGAGQSRDVTGSTQSTGVLTVSPNWTTNPSTDSTYRVVRSYTTAIRHAFNKLETMLYNKGKRHSLILESSQIEFPLIYLTLHTVCLDLMDAEGDKWSILADKYAEKFSDAFGQMRVEYDEDESGFIQGDEKQAGLTGFRIYRS